MAGVPIKTQIDQALDALAVDLNAELASSTHPNPYQAIWRSSLRRGCIVPTGSFACGVWNKGDDVHLIYMGPISHDLFWQLVHENLALASSEKLEKERRSDSIELCSRALSKGVQKDGGVVREFARLSRRDQAACRFYLHYLAGAWAQGSEDTSRKRNLEMLHDTQTLIKALSDEQMRHHFRTLYQRVYHWTQLNGLFGPKFGFLSSNHLISLVHGALPRTFPPDVDMLDADLAEAFQAEEFALLKSETLPLLCSRLASSEGFATLASTAHLSAATRRFHEILTPEAKAAVEEVLFWEEQASRDDPDRPPPDNLGYSHFLTDHAYYFHANCESWSLDGRAHFQDYDVPRNISKVIAAFRPATSMSRARYQIRSLRVWPEPIHYSPQQTEQAFLIGINLDAEARQGEQLYKERLADFQDTIEREVLDYNRTTSLITFTLISRGDLPALLKAKHTVDETLPDPSQEEQNRTPPSPSPPQSPKQDPPQPPPTTDPTESTPAFRSAHSAISRLRHDPQHTTTEYELGYEDRFQQELIWIPLEAWGGRATEDVDFIPEHRVRALRRAEDREVVWDRGRRVDLL